MEVFSNRYRLGIIITSYGYNGVFLEHTIKSFLLYTPEDTLIIVYIINSKDTASINLQYRYKNVYFKYENNTTYNISKIWNKGINLCFSNYCTNIIISRDDLIFTDCIVNIFNHSINNLDYKKCFVPVINCKNHMSNQNYRNYNNGLIFSNFAIENCLIIINKNSFKINMYKNNEYFNTIHKQSINSLEDWIDRFNKIGGNCMICSNTFVYCYFRHHYMSNYNKRCLYLINTGKYEGELVSIDNSDNKFNCDVILFTDNIKQIRDCIPKNIIPFYTFNNVYQDPQKLQRFIKTTPHLWLPYEYDISIYIDGNVSLTIPNTEILVNQFLLDYDLVCWKHPLRSTIWDEANEVANLKLAKLDGIVKILNKMKRNNFKDTVGLTETNILIRRHKNIISFSNKWSDYVNICRRDQISFDYLLYKYNINHKKYDYGTKPLIKGKHIHGYNRHVI